MVLTTSFILSLVPSEKNCTSSELASEAIIPCLLVSHQNQAVNSAQAYLRELLHCLPGGGGGRGGGEEVEEEEAEEEEEEEANKNNRY